MNRSTRLAAVLAVAAALISATGCNKLYARHEINLGVQAYKNARFEEAIGHFQKAASLDEKLSVAKLYLATAYTAQYVPGVDTPPNNRNAEMAIEQYKAVIKDDPQNIISLKGIASLYREMRKFDESRDFFKKAIDADPNDPEAYYSVGVLDWTAVYKDTADRKSKESLRIDDEMKGRDQKLCEEIKAANEARVEEGLAMLQKAMDKREDYDDAMVYANLLYLRKADMACSDPAAKADAKRMSEDWSNKAMAARKKKAEAAAKKGGGGIILDQPQK